MSSNSLPEFPFSAVIGQTRYKLALQLLLIEPKIGGLLVSGPRGTAKSTLARGIAEIAPGQCSFVNLPLGASEEMLVGTLDLQKAIGDREVAFHPGLFARADGGVLYVDEINLLPDHLVDLLLDVAAGGVNHIERDGISHSHDARFILLGTMNPDEGELRPQLLDRFGLAVTMDDRFDAADRVEIVCRREAFDHDPVAFCRDWKSSQDHSRELIRQAGVRLAAVECNDSMRTAIAERSIAAGVDGLRADIVWARAATAHASLAGRDTVSLEDLDAVEELVLNHRRPESSSGQSQSSASGTGSAGESSGWSNSAGDWGQMKPMDQACAPRVSLDLPNPKPAVTNPIRGGEQRTRGSGVIGLGNTTTRIPSHRINWFQTLSVNLGRWPLEKLRFHRHRAGQPRLHLVMLDTSASTLRGNRLAEAKAVVLEIAENAYLAREQMTILGFGNQQVETLLSLRRAPKRLRRLLDMVKAGGGTPLRRVIERAISYQTRLRVAQPGLQLCNYLVTDGRSSASLDGLELDGETWLIDIEASPVRRGRGVEFARALGAHYLPLSV